MSRPFNRLGVAAVTIAVIAAFYWSLRTPSKSEGSPVAATPERPSDSAQVEPSRHSPLASEESAVGQEESALTAERPVLAPEGGRTAAKLAQNPKERPASPGQVSDLGKAIAEQLEKIRTRRTANPPKEAAAFGTLTGSVTGLRPGESGGVFAMKGKLNFSNVTEDDLYDFGEIADGEARFTEDRTFTMRGLEPGQYTILALSEQMHPDREREFRYTYKVVEIVTNRETKISMSLD